MADRPAGNDTYRFADLVLDPGTRQVKRGDTVIDLPAKSFDVLEALVRAAPETLSYDELMDRTWRGTVVSQATVAKRIELLRQALDDDSKSPRYVALVRRYGYRLIPPVVTQPRDTGTASRRGGLIPVLLVAGLAAALFAGLWLTMAPNKPPDRSIAVLPFVAISDDHEDRLFADGLTDELSHVLSSNARLMVTGRMSAAAYRGTTESAADIGEALGVAHLLQGSVRRSGKALRVTAELVDATNGFSLWSASYDREMADLIDIQRDIAGNVATQLEATLTGRPVSREPDADVIDPETYALYLRAVSLSPYGKLRNLGEAQRLIEIVTERAPGFDRGWNRLAAIYGRRFLGRDAGYDKSREETLAIGRQAVGHALSIDPDSAEAYANLGGLAWAFEADAVKAAPLIERAVSLDPYDLDIVSFAAEFAKFIGRLEEALALERIIVERDPLCAWCRIRLAQSYLFAGRPADALREFQKLRSMRDGYHWPAGVALLLLGRPEEALVSFEAVEDHTLALQGQAIVHCERGDRKTADQLLQSLEAESGDESPQLVAQAFAWCGDNDRAFRYLDRLLPAGIVQLQTSYLSPLYDRLHDDPRWDALLRRIDRAPEQVKSIPFSLETARAKLESL